jgi:hypothetical protein
MGTFLLPGERPPHRVGVEASPGFDRSPGPPAVLIVRVLRTARLGLEVLLHLWRRAATGTTRVGAIAARSWNLYKPVETHGT